MGLMCIIKYKSETYVFSHVLACDLSKNILIVGIKIKELKRVCMTDSDKKIFLDMIIDGVLEYGKGNTEYYLR